MITENVLRRTFLIRYGESSGTGFLIEKNDKQYLVTAKHVISGIKQGDDLHISFHGDWVISTPTIIGYGDDGIDISVLSLDHVIFRAESVIWDEEKKKKTDVGGVLFGQEVYFLGFPFGLFTDMGALNANFPMPIIKKALFSGKSDSGIFLLDGINNPGFSGGPVIYRNPFDPKSKLYVMSVVSAYHTHNASVQYMGKNTPFSARENTGIIVSYDIKFALDIIDGNPNGAPL